MYYNVNDITDDIILEAFTDVQAIKKKGIEYFNCPCSFDIETSSFYINPVTGETIENRIVLRMSDKEKSKLNKHSVMYLWQLDLNGLCMYGRLWDEYLDILKRVRDLFQLDSKFVVIIYVHNLAYEFQYMRKYLYWDSIFAREKRKPISALCTWGFLFKCSYFLSGLSLKKIAENLHSHDIKKLDTLDYEKIRSPITPLTEKELLYSYNDIVIIEYFIAEEIERNGDITKIPLTNTGYVRKFVKENCYGTNKKRRDYYSSLMQEMTLTEPEYKQLKRAFQGGFTHANAFYTGQVIKDVHSIDFNSSYPGIMISEMFPMSKGEVVRIKNEDEFKNLIKYYCCIFDIEFYNIRPKIFADNPISESKCVKIKNGIINNGRVVTADYLITTITEVDFKIYEQFYEWDYFRIGLLRRYERDYLPREFVHAILMLYKDKTELKDISEKAVEYLRSKGMVNSAYGMTVTDICPDDITYEENVWGEISSNIANALEKYNTAKRRFLFYPWGIYVTAYARSNLLTGIIEFNEDYIYSDTDSIKCINYEKHLDYVNSYNQKCLLKNQKAMERHNLPLELTYPKDSKGKERHIGVWDYEQKYDEFKTLGAKRYMVKIGNEYNLTVSGVNKKGAIPYLMKMYNNTGKTPIEQFTNHLVIPPGEAGKNTLTYIDDEQTGTMVDMNGQAYIFNELSCCHIEPAGYSFDLSVQYLNFLNGIQDRNLELL